MQDYRVETLIALAGSRLSIIETVITHSRFVVSNTTVTVRKSFAGRKHDPDLKLSKTMRKWIDVTAAN